MALILVIDDEPMVLETMRLMLERYGHDVVEADSGRKGEELFAQRRFDLVITDILMPDQEGIETIGKLRQRDPAIKILAMSGGGRIGNQEFLSIAAKLGATATIGKPFTPAELNERVSGLLAGGAAGRAASDDPQTRAPLGRG